MCLWYKEGTRRIMRPDELPFVVRRSICIWKESSSRRTMRLVPVFILETHNQTNYKCFTKFVQSPRALQDSYSSTHTGCRQFFYSNCLPGTCVWNFNRSLENSVRNYVMLLIHLTQPAFPPPPSISLFAPRGQEQSRVKNGKCPGDEVTPHFRQQVFWAGSGGDLA